MMPDIYIIFICVTLLIIVVFDLINHIANRRVLKNNKIVADNLEKAFPLKVKSMENDIKIQEAHIFRLRTENSIMDRLVKQTFSKALTNLLNEEGINDDGDAGSDSENESDE